MKPVGKPKQSGCGVYHKSRVLRMLLRKFLCNVNDTRVLIGLCLLVTSYLTLTHIVIVLLLHATYPFFYSSQDLPLLPKAHFPSKLEMIYIGHPVSARRRSLKVKFITRMLLGVCRALHLKHTRITLQNTVFKGKTIFCASGNVLKFQLFFSIMTYKGGQLKQSRIKYFYIFISMLIPFNGCTSFILAIY